MLELYYWLKYLYSTFSDEILIDIRQITNTYNYQLLADFSETDFLYSDDSNLEESEADEPDSNCVDSLADKEE